MHTHRHYIHMYVATNFVDKGDFKKAGMHGWYIPGLKIK